MNLGKSKILILLFLIIFIFLSMSYSDPPGSKDHPLISRYPGSFIIYYEQKNFNEFLILLPPKDKSQYSLRDCKEKKLEGKVTKIIYKLPPKRSAYEVFKNYEIALKEAGFQILTNLRTKGIRYFLESKCGFPGINGFGSENEKDHFYIVARTPAKDVYAMIYVGDGYKGRPGKAAVGVVEIKKMETGLITANIIKNTLYRAGHIAIYGIYFDFNKAEVKPESEQTIKEIAKFLNKNRDIKLYVVGHTDNIGKLDYNMVLSKRRAQAVVDELIQKYKVSKNRLKAFGVGPLCPVASNNTESGRARNRRVELVKE